MKYRILGLLLLVTVFVFAQQPCGTDDLIKQWMQNTPDAHQRIEAHWEQVRNFIKSEPEGTRHTIVTIPVVFHVINSGQPVGTGINISDAQLLSQIDVLNECFRKRNADTSLIPNWFKGREADIEVEFCLATATPQGTPTTGITRDYYTNTSNFDANVKPPTQWDPTRYLNIWTTILTGNILGYATPPFFGPANQDGIVLDYRYVGKSPANPFGSGKMGKTCVHEAGHYLGLFHTFQDSCTGTTPQTCGIAGDRVCDTPPSSEATFGSSPNLVQNTCTETPVDDYDMWMNYMDYVDDNWLIMFTKGQRDVMRAVLNTSRLSLQSSLGCTNTANTFTYTGKVVDQATQQGVAGAKVLFDGPQDFETTTDGGGNFTINNLYEGYYDVYAGKWGYRESFYQSHGYFSSGAATINIPIVNHHYYDDFLFNFNWSTNNSSNGGFWTRDIPVGTFYQSLPANPAQDISDDFGLKSFITGNGGISADLDDIDNGSNVLTSPAFDLSGYTDPYLRYYRWFFDGAISGNTPDDVMTVKLNNGSTTVTVETLTASANQWTQKVFRISDFITPTATMRLVLEVSDLSAGNPNIVEAGLDRFEVLEAVAVSVEDISAGNVRLFPNPTQGMVTVQWLQQAGNARVSITNLLGQEVYTETVQATDGKQLSIDLSNQPNGLYLARIRSANSEKVLKFSISR